MSDKDSLYEIHRSIGRVEGKLDALIASVKASNDNHDGLETRVRKVEHKQYWFSGAASVIGMVGSFILHSIFKA